MTPNNDISVVQAATLLRVPEQTIVRWVRQGLVPTHRLSGEIRFDRQELVDWARHKQIHSQHGSTGVQPPAEEEVDLLRAIEIGGVHTGLRGGSPDELYHAAVELLPIGGTDATLKVSLLDTLLERELLSPTGLGYGVALPHPRHPRDWGAPEPIVGVFFLETPADFHAFDGEAVFVLFMVLCRTVKGHLLMLSQVSHLLKSPGMIELLHSRPSREALMERIAHVRPARRQSGIRNA